MPNIFLIVVSGNSEYGKSFTHVFEVAAEDKDDARRVAIEAMNEPQSVLREFQKSPNEPHTHDLSYRFNFIIKLG